MEEVYLKLSKHKPAHKAIHIGKSHEPTLKPKLANKYVFANARREEMKLVANFKEKNKEIKESQCITLYISNGGYCAINETDMNKSNIGAIMKVSAIKSATAHILVRYKLLK